METFSALLAICAGNCAWINGWVNNGEAGDLRRHRAHYDVTVIALWILGRDFRVDGTLSFYILTTELIEFHCLYGTLCQAGHSLKIILHICHLCLIMNWLMGPTLRVVHIDGLVQERRNPSALTMELRLSCINLLMYDTNIMLVGQKCNLIRTTGEITIYFLLKKACIVKLL